LSGAEEALARLRTYIERNTDISSDEEICDFLLNSLSDFYEAARHIGIHDNPEVMRILLGYDAFDEFWVETHFEGEQSVTEGYRTKHNSARGGNKGGLRIDMVVKFVEVAALAFMMTWKCARSKILFGGGKGGLKLNPKDYTGSSIDYFDTLTNFGRLLFLVTGSFRDVPAGDVGCRALEIGHLFEGFKSALRDLAMTVYGLKKGVSFIGNTVVSIEGARSILQDNFGIDCDNQILLERLATDEDYLELVVAAQLTGKPKLGLSARSGATGSGLRFSLFAAVAQKYLSGGWESSEPLSAKEKALLVKVSSLTENDLVKNPDSDIIPDSEWAVLDGIVFPKLFTDKKVVVQGSGDVGGSIMSQLVPYGVRITAVADAGGAVIGENLDAGELLAAVRNSRAHQDKTRRSSVVNTTQKDVKIVNGAREGSSILELECDILIPAALENAITVENARKIKAKIISCGGNGTNSSKAERILVERGITVIYDFLANGGGVDMSYAEWLSSLTLRFRYEAREIFGKPFDINCMDAYIMPEFRGRIKKILSEENESEKTTAEWNKILRDIMFVAVNEDYTAAARESVSMKTAGFANAIRRVLSAVLLKLPENERVRLWKTLRNDTRSALIPFMRHPEAVLLNAGAVNIAESLSSDGEGTSL
jgi:glutamate dehydrogenase/leucine dehydrogenase